MATPTFQLARRLRKLRQECECERCRRKRRRADRLDRASHGSGGASGGRVDHLVEGGLLRAGVVGVLWVSWWFSWMRTSTRDLASAPDSVCGECADVRRHGAGARDARWSGCGEVQGRAGDRGGGGVATGGSGPQANLQRGRCPYICYVLRPHEWSGRRISTMHPKLRELSARARRQAPGA